MVSGTFVLKTIRSLEHSFPWWNFRSRDHSFPGTFVLKTIRSLEHSFPGPFVPWTVRSWTIRAEPQKLERVTPRSSPRRERSAVFIRSRERMVQETNGPENECSRERIVLRTKVPWNEWSRERKFHHGNECSRERIVLRTNIPAFSRNDSSSGGVWKSCVCVAYTGWYSDGYADSSWEHRVLSGASAAEQHHAESEAGESGRGHCWPGPFSLRQHEGSILCLMYCV